MKYITWLNPISTTACILSQFCSKSGHNCSDKDRGYWGVNAANAFHEVSYRSDGGTANARFMGTEALFHSASETTAVARKLKKTVFVFCICLLLSGKAISQFYTGPDLSFGMMSSNTFVSNMNLISSNSQYFAEERRRNEKKSKSAGDKSDHTTTVSSAGAKMFIFTSNSVVSEKVRNAIIANNKKRHPDSKLGEALSEKNNPYPNYVKLLHTLGLDVRHNYADAFTAYLLGMWRIANKLVANPTKKQINYVQRQVSAMIDVGNMNNTQKQEAAEYLIYDLIFANEPYEYARQTKNQEQVRDDSEGIYQRFLQQNKMNLRTMIITENGLVKKSNLFGSGSA